MYNEKKIVESILLASNITTYYTMGAYITKAIIKEIRLCNVTDAAVTVTIHLVPSGDSAKPANAEYYNRSVAAGETLVFARTLVVEGGSSIQAKASVNGAVGMSVSGVEKQ